MHAAKSSYVLSDAEDNSNDNSNEKESGNSNSLVDNESDHSSLSSSEIIHRAHNDKHTRKQSFRSVSIQRELSHHIQSVNIENDRMLRLRTISQNNDESDFVILSTRGADKMRAFCGCFNIYNLLYFVSFYHLFMSIPLLCIGFVMFDIDIIINNGISNKLLINDNHQLLIFIFYIFFGLLRFVTFSFGIYLIPKLQYENLATLDTMLYNSYKRMVKIWLALLLLSPILYDILLIVEYFNDLQIENKNINKLDNTAIFIFLLFVCEMLFSIYFFFQIHGFILVKWPTH
eukprot:46428_1